jgi:hypothetical protein
MRWTLIAQPMKNGLAITGKEIKLAIKSVNAETVKTDGPWQRAEIMLRNNPMTHNHEEPQC